jgi:glycopeptide antibiotics resistance protein
MPRPLSAAVGWLLWTAVIILGVVPWGDFQGHTHWTKVAWIPFVTRPWKFTDIMRNVLLYVPLGVCLGRMARGRLLWIGLLLAAVLSIVTEATQLYSHYRWPSATDVVANLLGAVVGLYLTRIRHERAASRLPQENSI